MRQGIKWSLLAAVMAAGVTVSANPATSQGLGFDRAPEAYAAAESALYPQDPADSLYRAARALLNREEYRRAAEMFEQLYRQHPRSSYAGQAHYYEAFSLYRSGGDQNLRAARDVLLRYRERYSESYAAMADAESLMARIQGALARQGDAMAAEDLARTARELARSEERSTGVARGSREQACGGEDEIRLAALHSLMQMNSERALPILRKVLANRETDACSVEMRKKAVFVLAQHLDDRNVDIMLDIVRNDPDPEVKEGAVFWLSQVRGERALDALEDILLRSDERRLQEKAIFALSQQEGARASQILRDYAMRDGVPADLRANAIFWLGQTGRAENSRFLREVYGKTSEAEIKEKIIFSLAQAGGAENGRMLLGIATDEKEPIEIRKKAMYWAGQAGVAIGELAALYDRLPDRDMKEQVIFSLSQSDDRTAIDKLIDIARNEKDSELRKKAIFWLSQTDDPRVAELLMEIIEGR